MLHFIAWIIISGIAGFVASKIINKSGSGLLMDIVLGVVGGFVGGFIVSLIPGLPRHHGGLIAEAIVATLGALLVVFLWNNVIRKR
jgi:uncharacterized membrane protein YeaQ/YmgE (transglycosylase-associated protein family)